jgi:TATA-binding protein-associated factor Taf7
LYAANQESLAQIKKLYEKFNIKYNTDIVFESKLIQRISSYIVSILPNKQFKLLGQAVYEIGLDKPLSYIKSLKFYPREKMQGAEKIEAEIKKSIPDSFFN